ncbi:glycosyltransferase [Desulfuromonas sp. KJ2020]|uniref:glycosyltransferase n=1 Tax=Desulfuromonas sp. KJ2020 TaxID=2919173 RepID=UPI0020A8229C|nr:glycosyltransferase [Desulfuromonas sp. KJ2020]MCP3178137.1 glycosyltransferase [Desulfuromonas sp. KJ2020]
MIKSKTKVAYILTPITFGGLEKVSLNFLKQVDREKYRIQPILLIRPWEDETYFANEIRKLGYEYYTVPVAITPNGGPLRVPRVAWRLYGILKEGSFDVVHTHGYFADICGLSMAAILGIKRISTCHGFISTDFKLRAYNSLDKWVLRRCEKVIAVSDGIKTELSQAGIQGRSIVTIPNAVAVPALSETQEYRHNTRNNLGVSKEDYLLGYVGRLSSEKGGIHLVEAFALLVDSGVRAKLLIVGDGPEKDALIQLCKSKGIDHLVKFTGFLKNVEQLLPILDLFVLPSLTEGTPLALLEAMAAGVPVVATSVGGIPKVIKDDINGSLVPPGNPNALYAKIKWLISHPDHTGRLAKEGMETIRRDYGVDEWCRKIVDCYGI